MSRTEARYSLPSSVVISVPSPNHFWFTACAVKSRPTRSGARHRSLPGRVSDRRRFLRRAARPSSRISCATVFTLTCQPASRMSAVIRGDPYVPSCTANSRATSPASAARRAALGGNPPPRHLQNHAWDTPSARHDTACGI